MHSTDDDPPTIPTMQVEAPGTIVWNNASSGDITVSAPGVSVVRACSGS